MALLATIGGSGADPAVGSFVDPHRRGVGDVRLWMEYLSLLVMAIVCVAGCGGTSSTQQAPANDDSVLRGVLVTYATASRNLNRPPQNLDELKAVLASVADDPSVYFRSARDNQDFAIVWDLQVESAPPGTILACERTGVDGMRKAVTTDGHFREITAEEFAKLKISAQ